jgi:enoyl-CoA hydratase/carnithine racemase
MSDTVLFDVSDKIATVTLNQPARLNAFSDDMLGQLVQHLDECEARDDIAVVILTGSGRGFCSGGDVSKMGADADNRAHVTREHISEFIQAFPKRAARFDKPLIAAVNGVATGGGMDLALACDIRVAASSAKFAETYARIGLLPGGGGAWYLPRLVGRSMAMELLLSGDFIDADEALRIGLVNHVWPDDELLANARALAARIARNPPLSVRLIKRAVDHGLNGDMNASLDLIASHIAVAKGGHDHGEAMRAFKEKRNGDYVGY